MRFLLSMLIILSLGSLADAQERAQTDYVRPLGYCQLTASGTAALISTCSGGIPNLTIWAVICIEIANIRWRDDGTSPTATVGMPLISGTCLDYSGTMGAFSVIAQSGSPVIDISFYSGAPRS